MTAAPLADSAVVIAVGNGLDPQVLPRVLGAAAAVKCCGLPGIAEVVPAFGSVAVHLDPGVTSPDAGLCAALAEVAERGSRVDIPLEAREVEIPVCYGGDDGPDLGLVAAHTGLSPEAVVAAHAGSGYVVQAIGFAPGFPYLSGLDEVLRVPRRATPRPLVPAGSVGIGGAQTGVYPLATPGGWNLIGRTPRRLFDPTRSSPALLRMGDRLRFRAIGPGEAAHQGSPDPSSLPPRREEAAGRGVRVLRGGPFTTVQDLGRTGHRAEGVTPGGAADRLAFRVANLLVGNPEEAAALEFTQVGPELEFERDVVVALAGGGCDSLPPGRPIALAAGSRLRLGRLMGGGRGYLAIAGGIDVPPVLGSRSTDVRAGLGGGFGRVLREGDVLPLGAAAGRFSPGWQADLRFMPEAGRVVELRVIRGAQAGDFSADWSGLEFVVDLRSDRMGVRLQGDLLVRRRGGELASAPVVPGIVQVPPDGRPIILMADAQTLGGYPQVAAVIGADLPQVAQLQPGDTVRFREVDLAESRRAWIERERALAKLKEGLGRRWS